MYLYFWVKKKSSLKGLQDGTVVEQAFRYNLNAEPEYSHEGEEGVDELREMGFPPGEESLDPSGPSPQGASPKEKGHMLGSQCR